MNICSTMNEIPTATLYHAIDRNWSIRNCAKMTASPKMLLRNIINHVIHHKYYNIKLDNSVWLNDCAISSTKYSCISPDNFYIFFMNHTKNRKNFCIVKLSYLIEAYIVNYILNIYIHISVQSNGKNSPGPKMYPMLTPILCRANSVAFNDTLEVFFPLSCNKRSYSTLLSAK